MSVRRSFRGAVEGPRPRGAILMVAAASATLAISGQLALWVPPVQLAALAWAFTGRERGWQRSPWVLNTALAALVGLAVSLWLRGQPGIVALAHFATLAQALQIVDARPRRSEFLLVALALFQVVLASNLTDSVLFPPLLVAFLMATVWTLLLHTLQVEALEAGDPIAARRIATPGLLRTTLLASTLSVLLALVLFVLLPRMRASVMPGAGFGTVIPTSGFSDQVELGELGRIRSDPRAVLHVETLEGGEPGAEDAYWRGIAFDHFDGRVWSVTPAGRVQLMGDPEMGMPLGRRGSDGHEERVQRIVREPVEAGVLFAAGRPTHLRGALARVERDPNGSLYVPEQEDARIAYTVATRARPARASADDRALAPLGSRGRYLQLPELAPFVGELAHRIAGDAGSPAERAARLEAWLRANGRYTDDPPDVGREPPLEAFLGQGLAGHCEYFASSMVVLARSLGLPARLVNGFAGGRRNRIGGFVTLSRADAHAWVEIHFEGAGWVTYDPTPPDLRLAAAAGAADGLGERLAELASAAELWWFRRVVEFDRSSQARALRSAWLAWRRWKRADASAGAGSDASDPRRGAPEGVVDPRALGAALLALAGVGAAVVAMRRRRRRTAGPAGSPAYRRALRLLARRGLVREASTPARAFARQVGGAVAAEGAEAFRLLTEHHLAVRFGGRPPDAQLAHRLLHTLRTTLR